jgi:hypothetical protein
MVIGVLQNVRRPLIVEFLVVPQSWNRRECHSHRTADAVLALIPNVAEGAARDLGTYFALMRPGKRMSLRPKNETHQFVISGMKLDDVDPISETIMRPKLGEMAVRLPGEILHLLTADMHSGATKNSVCPIGTKHLQSFDEGPVTRVSVVVRESACLIQDFMCRVARRIGKIVWSSWFSSISAHCALLAESLDSAS